jgi:hypothetical protein
MSLKPNTIRQIGAALGLDMPNKSKTIRQRFTTSARVQSAMAYVVEHASEDYVVTLRKTASHLWVLCKAASPGEWFVINTMERSSNCGMTIEGFPDIDHFYGIALTANTSGLPVARRLDHFPKHMFAQWSKTAAMPVAWYENKNWTVRGGYPKAHIPELDDAWSLLIGADDTLGYTLPDVPITPNRIAGKAGQILRVYPGGQKARVM